MINIDRVYQKVLAIANKEQRGYITPQEFNLMAHKAQWEIINSYFHDVKTAYVKSKNTTNHADELEMVDRKLDALRSSSTSTVIADANNLSIPTNAIFVEKINKKDTNIIYTRLTKEENSLAESNPLTKATTSRPTYVKTSEFSAKIYPIPTVETEISIDYFGWPVPPRWGYVVIKGKALYNGQSASTTHFTLHISEEENLVNRILQLCGIIIQKPGLVEIGMQEKAAVKQDQND